MMSLWHHNNNKHMNLLKSSNTLLLSLVWYRSSFSSEAAVALSHSRSHIDLVDHIELFDWLWCLTSEDKAWGALTWQWAQTAACCGMKGGGGVCGASVGVGGWSQTSVLSVWAFTLSSGTNKKIPVKFSSLTLLRAATPACRMWRRRDKTCSSGRRRVCVCKDVCAWRRLWSQGQTWRLPRGPWAQRVGFIWPLTSESSRGWWQRSVTQGEEEEKALI